MSVYVPAETGPASAHSLGLHTTWISKEGDLLDLAAEHNLLEKSGAWFSLHGERIGQGRENARQFLRENIDITKKLEVEVRKALNLPVPHSSAAPDGTAAGRAKK